MDKIRHTYKVGFYALLLFLFAHRILDSQLWLYCLFPNFVEMFGYMLLMLCLVHWYNLFMVTTSMSLIHEQPSPHVRISCWQNYTTSQLSLLSWFTKYLLKFSYTCMDLYIVVLGRNWWSTWLCFMWHKFVWGESPQDHVWYLLMMVTRWKRDICTFLVNFINFSCRYMPLDVLWNFLQSVPLLWNVFKIVSVDESSCNFFCS